MGISFRKPSALFITSLVIILVSCINPIDFKFERKTYVKEGILDLRQWNSSTNPIVELDGEWEFYWDRLLTPGDFSGEVQPKLTGYMQLPRTWNGYMVDGKPLDGFGFATYRLTILVDDMHSLYGLKVTEMEMAYRIWVNGQLLVECGRVGKTKEDMVASWDRKEAYFHTDENEIEIVMQMSNFMHRKGGPEEVISFGKAGDIARYTARNHGIQYFLFGTIMLVGLYHLMLYLYRRKDSTLPYFAMACMMIALYSSFGGEKIFLVFFPFLEWDTVVRIGYLAFMSMLPALALFYNTIFRTTLSKVLTYVFCIIPGTMMLLVLVLPTHVFTWFPIPYQVCVMIYIVYLLVAMTRATIMKVDGAGILLLGTVFLVISGINDIAYNNMLVNTSYLFPIGVSIGIVVLIFSHSVYLARQFSSAFDTVEELSVNLEHKVEERTHELQVEQLKLTRMAREDELTGLYNRRFMLEMLRDSINRYERYGTVFSVLMLDLDHFKEVNDTYGHIAGDRVLKHMGQLLRKQLRDSDLAGRFGGEEFLVILPGTKLDGAMVVAEKIRTSLMNNRFDWEEKEFFITCSIGASEVTGEHDGVNHLLNDADQALYRAKEEGRNRSHAFTSGS